MEFAMPASFWNSVWISEGAVLMSTSDPDSNGLITKAFRLKFGDVDRVGFAGRAAAGVGTASDINMTTFNGCSDCNDKS
jgi:hypothetical protein